MGRIGNCKSEMFKPETDLEMTCTFHLSYIVFIVILFVTIL